jgi:hypothetical protein
MIIMSESSSMAGTSIQVVAPIGLFLLVIPLVAILLGVILSFVIPAKRKLFGEVLVIIGIFEALPFLINIVRDISDLIPYVFIIILLIYGCVSILCGMITFYFAKRKKV